MLFIFRCKSIAECTHTEQIHAHNLTQRYKVNNDREKTVLGRINCKLQLAKGQIVYHQLYICHKGPESQLQRNNSRSLCMQFTDQIGASHSACSGLLIGRCKDRRFHVAITVDRPNMKLQCHRRSFFPDSIRRFVKRVHGIPCANCVCGATHSPVSARLNKTNGCRIHLCVRFTF